jgi:hypothetical protein
MKGCKAKLLEAPGGASTSPFAFIWTLNKASSLASFLVFFALLCGCSVLYLQPFGVKYAGFVRAFVSMCTEIIALSL